MSNDDSAGDATAAPPSATDAFPYTVTEEMRSSHPFLDALNDQPLPEHHVPTLASNVLRRASSVMRRSVDGRRSTDGKASERKGAAGNGDENGGSPQKSADDPTSGTILGKIKSKVAGKAAGQSNEDEDNSAVASLSFQNPWPSFHQPGILDILRGIHWGIPPEYNEALKRSKGKLADETWDTVEVKTPDFTEPEALRQGNAVQVTWLGHATTLLRIPGIDPNSGRSFNILFDPIFSERCSPSQSAGPIRLTPAPCKVEDLPRER